MRSRGLTSVLLGSLLLGCGVASAQDETPPDEGTEPDTMVDEFADAMVEAFAPRWVGPRVEWPERIERPPSTGPLRSSIHPVNVHLGAGASAPMAADALAALEEAHAWLERGGWPTPIPDGGAGGTAGFDLYLSGVDRPRDEPFRRYARVSWDAPLAWGGTDAVTSFAVVDPDAGAPSQLRPCVISAYVQATLLGVDPAEAPAWREATGDYVAWLLTGRFGCSEEGLALHQRESWRTWIGDAARSGPGGALFLAMLSARTDGLSGRFIRDLWSGAPQLTWEGDQLRAAPDMWQVVRLVMEVGDDPLYRLLEEFAVARWFVGPPERSAGAPLAFLQSLPQGATVPALGRVAWDELPRRFEPHELELEPWGSAYLLVDTSEAPPESQLRIWLRGEMGVGWSLIAVRLAEDGSERGRVRAPVRPLNPRSYIPLELTDGQTAKVLIVVTNMGARLVDADGPDDQVRSFRMILDTGPDEEEEGAPEGAE